eukprot:CAMPEP_0181345012 /NCGR_PEP_ID=MMETSP1101-20121128/32511_1 /TAXON_ID=46948 /ORGANISM="Rhodomonas abbreviata, Strain Caron Lab Isolate" /LENGTH=216 /DNA_ID=CAMNT_0023456917 /DNA_START=54 /DNA_END=704 /DNA_ORIENTATION=+
MTSVDDAIFFLFNSDEKSASTAPFGGRDTFEQCFATPFDSFSFQEETVPPSCPVPVQSQEPTSVHTDDHHDHSAAVTNAPPLRVVALVQPSSQCQHGHSAPLRRRRRGNSKHRNIATPRPWSNEEHENFLAGLEQHNIDMDKAVGRNGELSVGLGLGVAETVAAMIGSRSAAQVRSHAQKYFLRMRRRQEFQAKSSNASSSSASSSAGSPDLLSRQ